MHTPDSEFARIADRNRTKAAASFVCCMSGVALAFFEPRASVVLYVGLMIAWLIPDRGIEAALQNDEMQKPVTHQD